jgi:predicted Zn-dependent protease with MMP-like domain
MKAGRLERVAADVVARTQRELPPEVREVAAQVAVHFEPAPAADVLAEGFEPDLLGLFTGDPLGSEDQAGQAAPPQIHLYMANLWDFAEGDPGVFRDEVRLTYLHELGHFLGWDEDQVTARGLD